MRQYCILTAVLALAACSNPPERITEEERRLIERLRELQPGVPSDGRGKGFWAKMKEALGA